MELKLDEQHKFAGIWMTNADQADPEVEAEVQRQVKDWHAKGCLPVICRSGGEALAELTSALLLSNRNRMAYRDAAAERAAGSRRRHPNHASPDNRTWADKTTGEWPLWSFPGWILFSNKQTSIPR